MRQVIHKVFWAWESEKEQAWLNDMAAKGLALVAVGHQMDAVLGINYIRTALCVAFLTNEGMSILENAGLMGIPIPTALQNALDVLGKKEETDGSH